MLRSEASPAALGPWEARACTTLEEASVHLRAAYCSCDHTAAQIGCAGSIGEDRIAVVTVHKTVEAGLMTCSRKSARRRCHTHNSDTDRSRLESSTKCLYCLGLFERHPHRKHLLPHSICTVRNASWLSDCRAYVRYLGPQWARTMVQDITWTVRSTVRHQQRHLDMDRWLTPVMRGSRPALAPVTWSARATLAGQLILFNGSRGCPTITTSMDTTVTFGRATKSASDCKPACNHQDPHRV